MINRGRFHSAAVGCRFAAIAVTSDEITSLPVLVPSGHDFAVAA